MTISLTRATVAAHRAGGGRDHDHDPALELTYGDETALALIRQAKVVF
jgi:hypothetical protein